jgi:hypothetical protein
VRKEKAMSCGKPGCKTKKKKPAKKKKAAKKKK